jgi:hypothetical protein
MRKVCLLLIVYLTASHAQVDRAAVTGALRDASGSAVPNASVMVVYPATSLHRKTTSSESGVYLITGLPLGSCYIEVTAAGFRTIKTEQIELSVGETRTLNLELALAPVETNIEVTAVSEAVLKSNVTNGDVLLNSQLKSLPINGRNWQSLMALVPGAVDPATGDQKGVRFFATGADDNNYRVDGVDATSIRNQNMRLNSRLLMSEDAIAEFRVNSSLFSVESGGTPGGQVEVVSKSGSNQFHGSAFDYLRNNIFDSRSPFDPGSLPPLRINEFGGTVGGPVFKDQTFFFLSYEGLAQRRSQTIFQSLVPTAALRARVVTASPVLKPVIDGFPTGNAGAASADVAYWNTQASQSQDEHVGMIRIDHRFSDRLTAYFRLTRNNADINVPQSLGFAQDNVNAPLNGLVEFLYMITPRSTNELRLAGNWVPWNQANDSTLPPLSVSVTGLATIPSSMYRMTHSLSESIIDSFSMLRGSHSLKAGVEIRRAVISQFYSPDGTYSYATIEDFVLNKLNSVNYTGENPARTMMKIQYFPYVQDEWKVKPNLTATIGLRYEFFDTFTEKYSRTKAFDIRSCGGYCQYGLSFGIPRRLNFAPRVSLAWSPAAFHSKTVIRAGGGVYYGDAQLGDQQGPVSNDTLRFSLSSATSPNIGYPVPIDPNALLPGDPTDVPRDKPNERYQQWGLQVQQLLPLGLSAQAGYMGAQNYHVFSGTAINLINPVTGKRPLSAYGQLSSKEEEGVSSYHGLLTSLQRTTRAGLFLKLNYTWSHAMNDGSAGGGDSTTPQNASCRSCEKARSQYDARHSVYASVNYALPIARRSRLGGWELSGLNSMRAGLPLSVTVSRKATDLPDGNSSSQRADLIPNVSLVPAAGSSIAQWISPAAFAAPKVGLWGTSGRNIVTGPRLFQIDAALSKTTKLTERTNLIFRAEVFNVFNHPQLGSPNTTFSTATFGKITSLVNQTPLGTGTCRSIQFALRLAF